ncbi:hypothetical protein PAECIP111891_07054 [Paenibacillus allorhizoplanae]|uniref:Uncharacterized protein n=1 Tax=Paenibacillus allorhizoplanae TaxID=2905648 RepID=A0ABN8HDL7_9BACL|nr:hypothetical protein [Paenibacillus allorhizoplanae]CAH1232606.1 hypothetical protein PAECIP111891_07054 [Paenibacillus allorhizoplanae]
MDNKLNENSEKVKSESSSSDVLINIEEIQEYNNLIESSETTTPETCRASLDGN